MDISANNAVVVCPGNLWAEIGGDDGKVDR